MLIAADHPARGALRRARRAGGDGRPDRAAGAAGRSRCPGPAWTACSAPRTSSRTCCCCGALEGKVVIGSMNRGGLAGAAFELDDRFTGYDADADRRGRLRRRQDADCRIDLADPATVATLEACARAVTGLAGHGLMAMVEPFLSRRVDGQVRNDLSTEAVVRSVAIASGARRDQRVHLAEAAGGGRHGRGDGGDHAAHPAARRRPGRRPGGDLRGSGRRRSRCPACAAWWSAGPCSTRPTVTSRPPSTSRPGWCTGERHERARGRARAARGRAPAVHRPTGIAARDGWACAGRPGRRRLGVLRPAGAGAGGRAARARSTPDRTRCWCCRCPARLRGDLDGGSAERWTAGRPSGADRPTSPTCRSARP